MARRRQEKEAADRSKGLISAVSKAANRSSASGMILARASELPQPAAETHFLRVFGQSDRLVADTSTTDGSVPQALMLMNGGVGQLISDTNCAAVTAAGDREDRRRKSRFALSRLPLPQTHRAGTDRDAKARSPTGLGLSDVAWALANTREFLFIQ